MIKKLAVCLLLVFVGNNVFAQYKKYSFQQPKMGSPFNIVIYSLDSLVAAQAALQTFKLIDTLNQIYSDYLPASDLNQLCSHAGNGEWVPVSETLFSIIKEARQASELSKGSFDITASPIVRLWRTARKQKKLPQKDSIEWAMQLVDYRFILLDSVQQKIKLLVTHMQLDLGGIAKGETAQRAYKRLVNLGFPYALIDAGGDIVAGDVPPGIAGWKVAVNLPETEEVMNRQLLLRNKAVTTSGDLYQYLKLDGVRYSHIINPKTGWALTNSRNVTVITNNGSSADWLTKACSILPIENGLKLIANFPGAEVQIAVLENNQPVFYRSPGFSAFFK